MSECLGRGSKFIGPQSISTQVTPSLADATQKKYLRGGGITFPAVGAVLGIDVGFSPTRKSSAVCLLQWNRQFITWEIKRFRAVPDERESTIKSIASATPLLAVALDGPLRAGFQEIGRYRAAERMLTLGLASRIGKPGQANAPIGKKLNAAANECARVVIRSCNVLAATHEKKIDQVAISEAFPSTFLGVMLKDNEALTVRRGNRSDVFFEHLAGSGELARLLDYLLPQGCSILAVMFD